MKTISKVILKILKNVILAFCFIYGFDLIATGMNIFIPINIITIAVVAILGLPGLLSLIGIFFILI